jgi:hypothetical protein
MSETKVCECQGMRECRQGWNDDWAASTPWSHAGSLCSDQLGRHAPTLRSRRDCWRPAAVEPHRRRSSVSNKFAGCNCNCVWAILGYWPQTASVTTAPNGCQMSSCFQKVHITSHLFHTRKYIPSTPPTVNRLTVKTY